MTDEKPKKSAPVLVDIYCVVANAMTSKGRVFHGDTVAVPKVEADTLKAEGKFT